MGRVIVVTSGKGGVGKSTCTANLGTALAFLDKKVVLVDADVGLRNLDLIMGLEPEVAHTSSDVIEGTCTLDEALVRDPRIIFPRSLKLLAASQEHNKDDISPEQMKKICLALKAEYDYVLIDSPAGIEGGFQNAVVSAEDAIIVTNPEIAAVKDADRVIGLLEPTHKKMHLIINSLSPAMAKAGEMLDQTDIVDLLGIELLGVIPSDRESVILSTNRGLPLTYNRNSPAGSAYRRIAQRLEGREIPMPEFQGQSWFGNLLSTLFKAD